MRLKFLLLGLFVTLGIFSGLKVYAIEESSSILMNIIPANPAPYEETNITLSSFSENLDSATISWFVDGKNVLSGVGKKSISVKAPASGSATTVVARISLPNNQSQVTTVIRPAEMVLLWQASDSYVPPFYKGKAMPAPDTFVKVVAIPEVRSGGVSVNPSNMTYAWQKDYDNVQDASGYGRSSYIFKNDYLENSNNIGVTATTTDQKYSSTGTINIGMANPFISFYKIDPALGTIWERALSDNYFLQGNGILLAAPYFISPKDIRTPSLVFNWSINDVPIAVESFKKNLMPLAVEAGTSGSSKVKLEIESTDKIFQSATKTINIQF